jgi:hypothetical protein
MRLVYRIADLGRVLRLCILIGYPFIAVVSTIIPQVQGELSIAYRAVVLALAFSVLIMTASKVRFSLGFVLVMTFLLAYLLRLLVDLFTLDQKTIYSLLLFFVGFVLVPVSGVLSCGIEQESDERLARLIVRFGLILMLFFSSVWATGSGFNAWADFGGDTDRLALSALNSISMGHAAVVVILASLSLLVHFRTRGPHRSLAIVAILAAMLVLYASNSRGPIVSAAAAMLWLFSGNLRRSWIILTLIAGTLVYLVLLTNHLDIVLNRFTFDTLEDQSNLGRAVAQRAAIDAFFSSPTFGAFSFNPKLSIGDYPHNLFIETAMTMGLVGLGGLLLILVYVAVRIKRFYNAEHPLLTALLVHQFVAIQFSGSIVSADAFFMMLGLAAIARRTASLSPHGSTNQIVVHRPSSRTS